MQGMMKAVVKSAAGPGFELKQVPIPQIGPHDILIRTRATSICGTDVHIYNWDVWAANRLKPPIIIGHEFCGNVVEVGAQVNEVKVDDFVSAESHIVDHTCDLCRTGMAHICRNTQIIGVDRDGKIKLSRKALLPEPEGGVPAGASGGGRNHRERDRGRRG